MITFTIFCFSILLGSAIDQHPFVEHFAGTDSPVSAVLDLVLPLLEPAVPHIRLGIDYLIGFNKGHRTSTPEGPNNSLKEFIFHEASWRSVMKEIVILLSYFENHIKSHD